MNYRNIINKYISEVESGELVACNFVKLAIKRHLADLKRTDIHFEEASAIRFLKFSSLCKYTKGDYAKKNLKISLSPQQMLRYWMLFGWKNLDGNRRFRKVYFEVARKNGKSEEAAIVCAYLLLFDDEFGAEIYTVATKQEQAKIVFNAAKQIIKKLAADSNKVRALVTIGMVNVAVLDYNSKLEPLSSQSNKQDGLNPHAAIIDEYHAHQNSDLLEVVQTGMGSRKQPLLLIITTAGFEKQYPCYSIERKVAVDVLFGIKKDDSLLAFIYTLDDGDDWKDKKTWVKSNPNIGITPSWEYMEQQFLQAKNQGVSKEVQFKTKNLNIWTNSSMAWISDENWMRCDGKIPDLTGRECYGGLDLAAKIDMNAFVLIFPPTNESEKTYVLPFFWLPSETVKSKAEIADYEQWVNDGYLRIAGDFRIDVDILIRDIIEISKIYKLKSFAYDPWGSIEILQKLNDVGIEGVELRQGFRSMSEPTKELEGLILSNKISHGGNPILRWHCSNIEISIDASDNIKIDKGKSKQKVDGMVALVNALACYVATGNSKESVYESRGVRIL